MPQEIEKSSDIRSGRRVKMLDTKTNITYSGVFISEVDGQALIESTDGRLMDMMRSTTSEPFSAVRLLVNMSDVTFLPIADEMAHRDFTIDDVFNRGE